MCGDRPTGTVTFLFTDVDGSTALLDELGAGAYAEALAEHRRLLRDAFGRHGGVEVDTQGDAFLVAFPTASGAVEAREGQQALADGPIRVRIGMHTGTPLVTGEGYVGVDVHRGARIAAVGRGGHVLVSAATRPPSSQATSCYLATWGAQAEGFRRAGSALPVRRGQASAAEDDLEHEPCRGRRRRSSEERRRLAPSWRRYASPGS